MAHETRSPWAYRTPSVLYAPAVGWSCMVSSRAVIFSEEWLCSRHGFGRIGGRAGTACPSAALCPTAETAHASIIRKLKCKNQPLAGRARSILDADISSDLRGCSHSDQQSVSRIKAPTSQFCIAQATYSIAPGKMILLVHKRTSPK